MPADSRFSHGEDAVLLAAILAGRTLKEAAAEAKIDEKTARKRLAKEDVRAELDAARREITAAAVAQLSSLLEVAVQVQRQLLTSEETPAAVRRSIANDVERAVAELGTSRDLESRIEELEARLGLAPQVPRAA